MKILSIIGSQRKNGNTASIVDLIVNNIQNYTSNKFDISVNRILLSDYNIQMCKGCRVCFNKGEKYCPLKDDLLEIKKAIDTSDIIIMSSPVYVEDVSGLLKNWIDRMAFVCHRPEYFGKSAYIISTSGGGSTKHSLLTMNTALRTWGFSIIGAETFKTGDFMTKDKIEVIFQSRINNIAQRIIKYQEMSKFLFPSFLSLMTFKIQQLSYKQSDEKESVDYKYWENKNWLKNSRKYYIECQINIFKVIIARALGSMIAKVVLK